MHEGRGSPTPEPSLNQLFQQLGRRSKEVLPSFAGRLHPSQTLHLQSSLLPNIVPTVDLPSVYETLGSKAVWACHSKGPDAVDPVEF